MTQTEYIQITHRELPFSVFDSDNHLYENQDALTKFLPPEYQGVVRYVDIGGRTKLAIQDKISDYIPNPTFNRVAVPGGAGMDITQGGEGFNRPGAGAGFGKMLAMPSLDASFAPEPRFLFLQPLALFQRRRISPAGLGLERSRHQPRQFFLTRGNDLGHPPPTGQRLDFPLHRSQQAFAHALFALFFARRPFLDAGNALPDPEQPRRAGSLGQTVAHHRRILSLDCRHLLLQSYWPGPVIPRGERPQRKPLDELKAARRHHSGILIAAQIVAHAVVQ